MPWIAATKPPAEVPAHYQMPMIISERPECLEDAKAHRKYWQKYHDEMIARQKSCGRDNRDAAVFFKEEGGQALKHLRGWKFVVEVLECYYGDKGNAEYQTAKKTMSEPIAPYADRALAMVCDTINPFYGDSKGGGEMFKVSP